MSSWILCSSHGVPAAGVAGRFTSSSAPTLQMLTVSPGSWTHLSGNRPRPGSRRLPVALLARRLDRITALADELGNGSAAIEADVTDRDSIIAAADRVRVREELGTAGALINAGVMLLGPFDSGQRADATVTRRSLLTGRAT